MRKIFIGILSLVLILSLGLFVACKTESGAPATVQFEKEFLSEAEDIKTGYNSNLFYVNTLDFAVADPTVIYITEGEDAGYFYAYGTSDDIRCTGFQAWRSKDLSRWEYVSVAFMPDYENAWAATNYWAPEIIYDENDKLYYLFYNAYNQFDNNRLCISVAYSESPRGPFVSPDGIMNQNGQMLSVSEPVYNVTVSNPVLKGLAAEKGDGFVKEHALDASPFVDPQTNKKYLYFSYYDNYGIGSFIYGMEMLDWFTPVYSSLTMITWPGYASIAGAEAGVLEERLSEGGVNEGPFVVYHEGKYYMTLSVYGYTDPNYQVKQAISDSPLGTFVKVDPDNGGKVISTAPDWGHIVSAGHHCFITVGDEFYIAYHTFKDRNSIAGGRALAIDKVIWTENADGIPVMHTNGPTWSVQPLPEALSGYGNIATSASVTASNTANGSNADLLNDELIKYQEMDMVEEYTANAGVSTIKLSWNSFKTVRSIMVYNSYDAEKAFVSVSKIEMEYKKANGKTGTAVIENVPFDFDWHYEVDYEFMRPGGAAIAEFYDTPVKSITITMQSAQGAEYLALSEIVVLGKDEECAGVNDFTAYDYEITEVGTAQIVNESLTFGDMEGTTIIKTLYGYDLSNDDGTEDAYILQNGEYDQYAYFNGIYNTSFYAEAEFTVTSSKPFALDPYPKFGMVVSCDDNNTQNTIFYYVDAVGYTNDKVGCAQRRLDNSDWDWNATEQIVGVPGISYTNDQYVKLAVLRIGRSFYLICNDKVAISYDTFNVFDDKQKAAVGFLSFNTPMKIKNYYASDDPNVVAQMKALYADATEGETFGKAGTNHTTSGWDLSNDRGNNAYAVNSFGGDQYAYFKNVNSNKYYVETEITVSDPNMGDPYPKIGLSNKNATNEVFFYLDCMGSYTGKKAGWVDRAGSANWVWNDSRLVDSAASDYIDGKYVKIGLLRDGNTFKFFVNGVLALTATDVYGFGEDDASCVAVLSFTTGVTVRNYWATTDLTDQRIPQ